MAPMSSTDSPTEKQQHNKLPITDYTSAKLISSATNDDLAIWRRNQCEGETDSLLRSAPAHNHIAVSLLHQGAIVMHKLKQLNIGVLDCQPVRFLDSVAFEISVPAKSLLLSEVVLKYGKLEIRTALRIARSVAHAVGQMHKNGMLHNDIRPDAILLLNDDLSRTNIEMSLLSLEYSFAAKTVQATPEDPIRSSSVAYAAPENSGRLPYSCDNRADLYSIGILLYELLAGELPYTGSTAAEVLHGHIAGRPQLLRNLQVPLCLCDVVKKLLQKDPDGRYQSCDTLLADLDIVLIALEEGSLETVVIGELDSLSRPRIGAGQFLGRQQELVELSNLICKFRSDQRRSRVAVIKGISGTGKSRLAERLFDSATCDAFVRAKCKFNQSSSAAPFGSLGIILDDLISQSMLLPPKDLAMLSARLAGQLAEDAPFVTALAPALKQLLSRSYASLLKSSEAYSISQASVEARTRAAVLQLLQMFTSDARPLLLYLDDIQWSSPIDLSVIQELIRSTPNVLIILTYRENELPEIIKKTFLENLMIDAEIRLESISPEDVRNLVESSVRRSGPDVDQLINIVTSRTAANMLFVKQYLRSLFDSEMIYFDYAERRWQIRLDSIIRSKIPGDVLDFVLLRLSVIGEELQRTLTICACLARPTIALSRIVRHDQRAQLQIAQDLASLCSAGFLDRLDVQYEQGLKEPSDTASSDVKYQFSHDRIQQACLHLVPLEGRADHFLSLGRTSLEDLDIESAPAHEIFDICDLFIKGMKDSTAVFRLIDIRLRCLFVAAARLSNQPEVRLEYLGIASEIQNHVGDEEQGSAAHRELQALLLETYLATGEAEKALRLVEIAQEYTVSTAAQITILQQKAKAHWINKNDAKVREAGEEGLRLAGFNVHFDASAEELMPLVMHFMSLIPQTAAEVASRADLPLMTDEVLLASQSLLVTILPSIFFVSAQLIALVLTLGVSTVFVNGISTDGCYLLSFFGLASSDICSPGYDYAKAKALADLAVLLSERIREGGGSKQDADILATMYVLQGGVNAWHINDRKTLLEIYQESGTHTKRAYNSEYIAYSMRNAQGFFGIARGHSLLEIDRHFGPDKWLDLIRRGDEATQAFALPTMQTSSMLLHVTEIQNLSRMQGDIIPDEEAFVEQLMGMPGMHQAIYYPCKVLLALLMQDSFEAERQLRSLFRVMPAIQGLTEWAFACIIRAFVLLDVEDLDEDNTEFFSTFLQHLDVWSRDCCNDFEAVRLFFSAESILKAGDIISAVRTYETAVKALVDSGNLLLTGLFAERCHKKLQILLGDTVSVGFLRTAERAFSAWGCVSKVNQLRLTYPQAFDVSNADQGHLEVNVAEALLSEEDSRNIQKFVQVPIEPLSRPELLPRATSDRKHSTLDVSSINQDILTIDLSTIIEVTSLLNQTTDSQEVINALLRHLIRIAGASLGAVILKQDQDLLISAIADHNGIQVFSDQHLLDQVEHYKLPSKIIHLSMQIEDIISDGSLKQMMSRPSGSFLVLPLVHGSVVLGAVYMENQHVSSLFASETGTIDLIAVLVGQVASQLSRNNVIAHLRRNKEELLQAKSQVEYALEVRNRIMSTVSHELRTPFNSILGFANLLLDTPLSEQQIQMTESIQTSSQHLLAIINDILDYSQIEQGALKLHPTVFSLRELVSRTLESIQPAVLKKRLDVIHLETGNFEDANLLGDEGRIRQCLLNLVSNAIKFSSDNIVIIKTKLDWLEQTKKKVTLTLSVTDRGIGIASEDQSKLFEHFSQIDNSLSRTHEGTGLGLAITKRIVQLFNGTTFVDSTLGKGSTFTVSFQLYLDSLDIHGGKVQQIGVNDNFTVVILDQYTERAEAMKNCLDSLNMQSKIVLDLDQLGSEANSASAVVISDTSNYTKYLNAIQTKFGQSNLPVLATVPFTAMLQDTIQEALGNTITAFIPTPLHREKVQKLLKRHLASGADTDSKILRDNIVPDRALEVAPDAVSIDVVPNLRLLTVDDNIINISVAKQFLKREGLETDTAFDGFQAVAKVKETAYDVICMDIQMPLCDGVEACRRIRELYKHELGGRIDPYIIALTANAIVGDKERYLASGMNDYLSKPLNRTALQGALARARACIKNRRRE